MPENSSFQLAPLLAIVLDQTKETYTLLGLANALEQDREHITKSLNFLEKKQIVHSTTNGTRWTIGQGEHVKKYLKQALGKIIERNNSPLEQAITLFEKNEFLAAAQAMLALIDRVLAIKDGSGASILLNVCIFGLNKWKPEEDFPETISLFPNIVLTIQNIALYLPASIDRARTLTPMAREAANLSGNARALALLDLVEGCFSSVAPKHDPAYSHLMLANGMKEIQKLGDSDIAARAANFLGLLHFLLGDYENVLEYFEVAKKQKSNQIWQSRYFAEKSCIYTSSAAMYLGRFSLALGMLEAAKPEGCDVGRPPLAPWWRMQMTMVLLYMGKLDEALEHLDYVLNTTSNGTLSHITVWSYRALAYYHYLRGNILASYYALSYAISTGNRYKISRLSVYPWMPDLLYAYKKEGFPPIEGMELEEELERIFYSPNKQMHAAALRIRALLLEDNNAAPAEI